MPKFGFAEGFDMAGKAIDRMRAGAPRRLNKHEKRLMQEQIKKARQDRENEAADREEAARKRKLLDPEVLEKLDRKEAKSAIKGRIQENRKQGHLNEQQKLANLREQKLQDAQTTAGYFTFKGQADAETEYAKLRASQIKRARDQRTENASIELDAEKRKLSAELTKAEVANGLTVSQTRQNNATAQQTETDNLTREEHNRSVIRLNDANAKNLAADTSETLQNIGRKKKDAEQKVRDEDSFKAGMADVGVLVDMARNSSDPESTISLAKGIVDDLTSAAARLGPAHTKKLEEFTTKTFPELLSKFRASALHKEKQRIQANEDVMAVMLEAKSKANPAFRRQYDSWTPEMKREHDVVALVRRRVNETGNVHMNQLMNDPARKGMFIKYKLHNDPNQRWAMDAKGNQLKTKDGELVPNLIIDEDATFAALDATLTQYKAMGPLPRGERMDTVGSQEQFQPRQGAGSVIPSDPNAQPTPIEKEKLASDSSTTKISGTPPWEPTSWQDYRLAQNAPSTAAELLSSMEGVAGEHDLWLAQQGALEGLSAADQRRLAQWTNPTLPANLQPSPTGGPPAHQTNPPTLPTPGAAPFVPPPTGQPPAGQPPTGQPQPPTQTGTPPASAGAIVIGGIGGKKTRSANLSSLHADLSKSTGNQQMSSDVLSFLGENGVNLDASGATGAEVMNAARAMAKWHVDGISGTSGLPTFAGTEGIESFKGRTRLIPKELIGKKGLQQLVAQQLLGTTETGGFDVDIPKLEAILKGTAYLNPTIAGKEGTPVKNLWNTDPSRWPKGKLLLPMLDGEMDRSENITWDKAKVDKLKRQIEAWKKWKAFKDKIDQIK